MLNSDDDFEMNYDISGYGELINSASVDSTDSHIKKCRVRCHHWKDEFPSRRGSENITLNRNKTDEGKFQKRGRSGV